MLATRVRVRPCSERCSLASLGRTTVSVPFSMLYERSGLRRRTSVPFGPFTVIVPSSAGVTVTPAGTAIGRFPIRDMFISRGRPACGSPPCQLICSARGLPDVAEDFSADALLARVAIRHDAVRRGEDRDAETAKHARHLLLAAVDPQAGLAYPLEVRDDLLALRAVLEADLDLVLRRLLNDIEALHESFAVEDFANLDLKVGAGNLQRVVVGAVRIADARQQVRDRIGGVCHLCFSYQLDFVTPGISPLCAISRKQIRQIPNRRKTARARPHTLQRV